MLDVDKAIEDSSNDFVDTVWPRIKDSMGGGSIVPVETVTDSEFARALDFLAGIDAWHVLHNNLGMRGIASRVQWGERNGERAKGNFGEWGYQTFTIRYSTANGGKTEWEKRIYAICAEPGEVLFPYITSQAYLDTVGGRFLSGAVINTQELITLAVAHTHELRPVAVRGGNQMLVIKWSTLAMDWGASTLTMISSADSGDLFDLASGGTVACP